MSDTDRVVTIIVPQEVWEIVRDRLNAVCEEFDLNVRVETR